MTGLIFNNRVLSARTCYRDKDVGRLPIARVVVLGHKRSRFFCVELRDAATWSIDSCVVRAGSSMVNREDGRCSQQTAPRHFCWGNSPRKKDREISTLHSTCCHLATQSWAKCHTGASINLHRIVENISLAGQALCKVTKVTRDSFGAHTFAGMPTPSQKWETTYHRLPQQVEFSVVRLEPLSFVICDPPKYVYLGWESRYASPKIPMQNSQCLEHKLLEERGHIHSGAMACAPVVDIQDNCKGLRVADILRNLGIRWHQVILSNVMHALHSSWTLHPQRAQQSDLPPQEPGHSQGFGILRLEVILWLLDTLWVLLLASLHWRFQLFTFLFWGFHFSLQLHSQVRNLIFAWRSLSARVCLILALVRPSASCRSLDVYRMVPPKEPICSLTTRISRLDLRSVTLEIRDSRWYESYKALASVIITGLSTERAWRSSARLQSGCLRCSK